MPAHSNLGPRVLALAATAILFIALGTGLAFGLPGKNSVDGNDLRKNAVSAKNIKPGAVTAAKLKADAVNGSKVKADSLGGTQIDESRLGEVPSATRADSADTIEGNSAEDLVMWVQILDGPNQAPTLRYASHEGFQVTDPNGDANLGHTRITTPGPVQDCAVTGTRSLISSNNPNSVTATPMMLSVAQFMSYPDQLGIFIKDAGGNNQDAPYSLSIHCYEDGSPAS